MPKGVLGTVLTFSIWKILGLLENDNAILFGVVAVCIDVLNTHHDRMGHLAFPRRLSIVADIPDDEPTAFEAELGAMVLANPHPFNEPKDTTKPIHRFADIGINEHGNDACLRN